MSFNPNFCSNCGEELDTNTRIEECPKCHSALHEHSAHVQPTPSIVEHLPYKSPGIAALVAFIGGIFGLPGIGHIYVGKLGRGIGILILGLILYVVIILTILWVGFIVSPEQTDPGTANDLADMVAFLAILISGTAYIVLFIWQMFNARNLARTFNEIVRTTGREPW